MQMDSLSANGIGQNSNSKDGLAKLEGCAYLALLRLGLALGIRTIDSQIAPTCMYFKCESRISATRFSKVCLPFVACAELQMSGTCQIVYIARTSWKGPTVAVKGRGRRG